MVKVLVSENFDHSETFRNNYFQAGVFRDNQATVPSTTARPGVVPGSLTSTTTETNRFFPPGELQLDRFPEGFKFDFRSNK